MAAEFFLVDGDGRKAVISPYGEIKVGPYDYSTAYFKSLAVINTAYNFVHPIQDQFFVITAVLIQADKDVHASTAAIIDLYESGGDDDTTIDKSVFQIEMLKNERVPLVPLNIKVSEGKFLNGKTNDATVLMTVTGYYVIC